MSEKSKSRWKNEKGEPLTPALQAEVDAENGDAPADVPEEANTNPLDGTRLWSNS